MKVAKGGVFFLQTVGFEKEMSSLLFWSLDKNSLHPFLDGNRNLLPMFSFEVCFFNLNFLCSEGASGLPNTHPWWKERGNLCIYTNLGERRGVTCAYTLYTNLGESTVKLWIELDLTRDSNFQIQSNFELSKYKQFSRRIA